MSGSFIFLRGKISAKKVEKYLVRVVHFSQGKKMSEKSRKVSCPGRSFFAGEEEELASKRNRSKTSSERPVPHQLVFGPKLYLPIQLLKNFNWDE